ncbi:glucokinase [Caldimonas sp. KR1-144]|uniref:glucokinase n=1 Tax=Caldimonas sp. KR1-144 TaxID=3400911 RepID=UPI003C0D7C8B
MRSQLSSKSFPWLVADIGGTNARFGLVFAPGAAAEHVESLKCADYPTPQAAATAYLDDLSKRLGRRPRPHHAAIALASAIHGDAVRLTNNPWTVSRDALAQALGAKRVLLLNDFEALALALPRLGRDDVSLFGGRAQPDPRAPMAVIGPGTGLGVSSCVPVADGDWVALAAEGGHVTVAAADDLESDVLRVLRREYPHVSAERVLSGLGLPLLHRALCEVRGTPVETLSPEEITQRALVSRDDAALATLDTFCSMLGTFAGNVALTVGARGGVFVAGGIAQKLGEHLTGSKFRERFEAKGRFESYMARIATGLVIAPHAALTGAAQGISHALREAHPGGS